MVVVGADGTRRVTVLTGDGPPSLALVEGLARFQFAARRAGGRVWLEDVSPALGELLDLAGLRQQVTGQASLSGQAAAVRRSAAVRRGAGFCRGAALRWEAALNRDTQPGCPATPRDSATAGDRPAPRDEGGGRRPGRDAW